jgi:hypothetical protein
MNTALLEIDKTTVTELCPQANSIRPVVLQDKNYPDFIGVVGSCTMVRRNAKNFIVCTRHQLEVEVGAEGKINDSCSPLFISHTTSGELRSIPVESCVVATDPEIQELHDILIFKVIDEHLDNLEERSWFYPIEELPVGNLLGSFFVGYPSELIEISYEPLNVLFKTLVYDCAHGVETVSTEKHFNRYSYDPKKTVNLDGFSGGAVFSAYETSAGPQVFLSGIITRGGNGFVYVIDANYVANAIDRTSLP